MMICTGPVPVSIHLLSTLNSTESISPLALTVNGHGHNRLSVRGHCSSSRLHRQTRLFGASFLNTSGVQQNTLSKLESIELLWFYIKRLKPFVFWRSLQM
uniref:Uncharacterized protein n=1 Tax=Spongospora subterranea TaxID=70186 RepID=A0A0H5QRE7_9EUKA|eukprot:CRZ04613.1 hypothetical protein [Spongospora subterranea]